MKGFFASTAAMLSVAATAVAQSSTASAPFYLTLQSGNSTLNGTQLGTCHEGAAIESLCLVDNDVSTFQLNTTAPSTVGTLSWNLEISGGGYISEGLSFDDPILSTNVVHPQFNPSTGSAVIGFDDDDGRMYISAYYNDEVTPPSTSSTFELYDFYICETSYAGYVEQTLNFVTGRGYGKPTNPTCQYVGVFKEDC